MDKELLTLYSRVRIAVSHGQWVEPKHIAAFNTEIASLGYTFDGKVLAKLVHAKEFGALRTHLLAQLGEITGAQARHATLFKNFPYEMPNQHEYLVERLVGFLQNALGLDSNQFASLSCGHVIDARLFDLEKFGVCPICQFQVDELDGSTSDVRHDFKRLTPLKIIGYADDQFIRSQGNSLLARNASLSTVERTFLDELRTFGLTKPTAVFRENLPFVYVFFDGDVSGMLSGATDILRIATYLSDPAADLSLSTSVKFKVSTQHRRKLLALLESRDSIAEDLMRHRERWLRLAFALHVGSKDTLTRFPKTARAFAQLRNTPKTIVTFNRTVERGVRAKTITPDLLETLVQRAGEFMRRLDFLLRTARDQDLVLGALLSVVPKVTTKMLFAMDKYLRHRKDVGKERVFIPKGMINRIQVMDDKRRPITTAMLASARAIITSELQRRFKIELPPLGKVQIDPALADILIPFNQRGDSATNVAMIKGSKYPLHAKEVVRLFVHWTGDVDVDLSAILYSEKFDTIGHVAFTNLKQFKCVHSGDIQNAPRGASEFIDFDIKDFRKQGIRYVAAWVISFQGQTFNTFPCFAGFMERDALKSGQKYEPEAVRLKFDISGKFTSYLPLIFDLEMRKVIFADMASGRPMHGAVAKNNKKYAAALRVLLDMTNSKVTVADVLEMHRLARGDAGGPDVSVSLDNLDIEEIMRDYMQ